MRATAAVEQGSPQLSASTQLSLPSVLSTDTTAKRQHQPRLISGDNSVAAVAGLAAAYGVSGDHDAYATGLVAVDLLQPKRPSCFSGAWTGFESHFSPTARRETKARVQSRRVT